MKTPEEIEKLGIDYSDKINMEEGMTSFSLAEAVEYGYNKCQQDNAEIISFFEEIWEQMNGKTDEKGDMVYIPHTLSQKIRNYKSQKK